MPPCQATGAGRHLSTPRPRLPQGHNLPLHQHRLMRAIETCRTPALGVSRRMVRSLPVQLHIQYRSAATGIVQMPRSGNGSAGPQQRPSRVVAVEYSPTWSSPFPSRSPASAFYQQRVGTTISCPDHRADAAEDCRDPQRLGVEIGFFAVLHIGGRTCISTPHLHCDRPRWAVLSLPHDRWIHSRRRFLLPVESSAHCFAACF